MASNAFRTATELMVQYARYHRDRRNIATHFVGIPLIVFAIGVLLARAQFELAGHGFNGAELLWVLGSAWYLTRGNLALALATIAVNGLLFALGEPLAEGSLASWLAWGIGSFVLGWVIQFVGHYYEGRKPAFVDDLIGLMVGPMFVVGEALFSLGWGAELLAEIERRAGPTMLRDLAHPVA
jgi:uncharacterized membrane protein YGL010W